MRDTDQRPPEFTPPPAGAYAENRLFLTGRAREIDAVLEMAKLRPEDLILQDEIVIADLVGKNNLPGLEDKRGHVIRYYLFDGDVAPLIRRINQLAATRKLDVSADFDHLISATPWTATGSPWTAAGSPWTAAGSPWTAAGSPWTAAGSPWTAAGSPWTAAGSPWQAMGGGGALSRKRALKVFYGQWAFGDRGLRARVGPDADPTAGKGVRVGIFDTSPFPLTFGAADFNLDPDLHLTLAHPIPGGVAGGCGPGPAADHGLFIAGLIHALAVEP